MKYIYSVVKIRGFHKPSKMSNTLHRKANEGFRLSQAFYKRFLYVFCHVYLIFEKEVVEKK